MNKTAEVTIKVEFYDLDPMNVVWHGRYVQYLEVARCALLDQIGYGYNEMFESGYAWPIIDLRLRYVAPATFNQQLKIMATLIEWENRLKIDYVISDAKSGRRLTKASTIQVAVDMKTQEMCFQTPQVFLDKLGL